MKTLHFHPLASYCQKVLVGLYELNVDFTTYFVDLGNPQEHAKFLELAPLGGMPALVDDGKVIVESTIILEHVDTERRLFPSLEARAGDRFWDLHVHEHLQRLVRNKLRPNDAKDPYGATKAREALERAYAIADARLATRSDVFTVADCAAAPALFFAGKIVPFAAHRILTRYSEQLGERPSVKRTFKEAAPYLHMFPGG